MNKVAELNTEETLRAFNPNLPLIASRAALELDQLIRGHVPALAATKHLASMLDRSFQGSEGGGRKSFVDPTTASLVARAFQQSHWQGPVQTISDLVREAAKVAGNLKNPRSDANRQSLVRARAFCAALAESAASYQQSRYSQVPAHPYRR